MIAGWPERDRIALPRGVPAGEAHGFAGPVPRHAVCAPGERTMSIQEIHAAIPHRPPFLLVDEIVERSEDRIVCRKTFREDEWYFAGHYPTFPIAPGVLLCEAAMQAGAILLAQHEPPTEGGIPVAAGMNNVRFRRMVKPGDTIEMEVRLTNHISHAWFLSARVTCGGQLAVRLEFICAVAPTDIGKAEG